MLVAIPWAELEDVEPHLARGRNRKKIRFWEFIGPPGTKAFRKQVLGVWKEQRPEGWRAAWERDLFGGDFAMCLLLVCNLAIPPLLLVLIGIQGQLVSIERLWEAMAVMSRISAAIALPYLCLLRPLRVRNENWGTIVAWLGFRE